MNFFDFFKAPDINQGLQEYKNTAGAILVDVRTKQEFQEGHIPGSKNVPLQTLNLIEQVTRQKNTPIFVYCHSGNRSRQALALLNRMGYSNVKNLGGILSYRGKVEQ